MIDINSLFQLTIERQASDLHIAPDYFPTLRINGELYPLKVFETVTKEIAEQLLFSILNPEQKTNLIANKEIDFGFEFGGYRFRGNIFYTKNRPSGVFRLIASQIKSIDDLQLPSVFHDLTHLNHGLVLVTGPTGEGKSTTLASLINEINKTQAKNIITIEDPIEYVYPQAKSLINQRELHLDTHSWTVALRSALREDPDVVLVGEMRDYDTIQAVLTIAETGHLVFSTLHTSTTPEAINRIIDVFPAHQQNQIKSQLSSVLQAIISQRLVPDSEKKTRIPALEILINTPAVSSIIRDGKVFLLDNVLETNEKDNMILFEKYLAKLYQRGSITKETALAYAIRSNEIKKFLT
ncbi:MAG: twitching motility protein [Candidatus Parcubacteria bacterium]|jgi:twitching motility protein PilT